MRRFSKWFTRRNAVNTPSRWLRLETLEQRDVPAAFTAGNLAVYRIGDGSTPLTNAAATVFIDEYTPTGTLVQSIEMPSTGSSGRFVDSGTATSSGLLTRSTDGRFLVATAYDAALATTSVASATEIDRIIGRIDSSGTIDVSTKIPQSDGYAANNLRSAASVDGSAYWTSGAGGSGTGGVRYITHGSTGGSVQVSTTITNTRYAGIFGGQLFVSAQSGSFVGLYTVGSGTPTNSGNTMTVLTAPSGTAADPFGFYFLDRDASVAGIDTLYVANFGSSGLQKYSFDGSAWTQRGSIAGTYTGVVAMINGSNVDLYMTSKNTSNNDLVKHTDTAAFDATITAGTPTVLATVGANKVWRGMAFTPEAADTTDPTVSTVTSSKPNGAYTIGEQIDVLVQFSENVNVTGTPQLTLETGGTDRVVDFLDGSGTNTLRFRYTVQAGDTSLDLDYFDANSLVLNGGTIEDASGNEAILTLPNPGATGSLGANKAIVIDTTAPAVTGVTSSASGGYNIGDTISITVNFTEDVTVSGSPRLLLETGTTDREAVYVSGSGSNTLTFTYTVQAGDESLDLDYVATDSLGLNGGTIQDAALNDASLTLAAPGAANSLGANASIVVDGVVPDLVEFAFPGGTITNASTLVYDLEFTEDITGLDITDFNIVTTGSLSATITAILYSGTPGVYTVEVEAIGDGDLTLELLDDGTIVDTVGNLFRGDLNTTVSAPTVTVDQTVPTVLVSRGDPNPTNANEVDFIVDFSEAHTGFTLDDLEIVTTLSLTFISNFNQTSPTSYTITVNTGTGTGTLQLNFLDDDTVIDAAGNPIDGPGSATISGPVYDVDRTPPTVSGITLDPNPTNAAVVPFYVTFTEAVTGVDETDFTLDFTGLTGPFIGSVTGGGANWIVYVNSGSGAGTLAIDLVDDDSIVDAVGNPLAGGASSPAYQIDKVAPTILSIVRDDASPTNASQVGYTVTFSESVFNVDASDFQVNASYGGPGVASVNGASGSSVYTVLVNTAIGEGTLDLELLNDGSITDFASNVLGNSLVGQTYDVDTLGPTILSVVAADTNPTNAQLVNYEVTFSEDVLNLTLADFGLTTTGVGGAFLFDLSGMGTVRTVRVNTGSGSGTIRLDFLDTDAVTDAIGNPFGGAGTQDFTGGDVYTIDRAAPSVVSISLDDPSPTNASSVSFTVTFDEAVTSVDSTDFNLVTFGVSGAGITNVAGLGTTWTVTVNTGTGDGSIRLDLENDGSIVDASNNPLAGGAFAGDEYVIDKTAPTVVVSQASGQADPTTTQPILFTVVFSEPVIGFGATNLTLSGTAGLGSVSISTNNPSADGRTFDVEISNITSDGTITVSVAAGEVTDEAGNLNQADVSTDATVRYDANAPTVNNILPDGPPETNATSVSFNVIFSEEVNGLDLDSAGGFDNFTLVSSGLVGSEITSIAATSNPNIYLVTVLTGTGDGTLRLDLTSAGAIVDLGNNPLVGTPHEGDALFYIDRTSPVMTFTAVSPNPRQTAVDAIEINFDSSDFVNGLTLSDFSLTRDGAPVSLSSATFNDFFIGYYFTIDGLGTITAADGEYVLTFNSGTSVAADAAGNPIAGDASVTFVVDTVAPTATVTEPTAEPTNAASLFFTVTFSEPVDGLDLDPTGGYDNFNLVTTGTLAGSGIANVSATADPSVFIVEVTTGTGVGTVRLDLENTPPLADLAGNPIAGLPASSGTVAVDTIAPVATIDDGDADDLVQGGATLTYTIDVTDANVGTFLLAAEDVVNAGTSSVSIGTITSAPIAGGIRYTVPVTANTDGTVVLRIANTATFTDAAGNALSLPFDDNDTVTVDATRPSVTVNQAGSQGDPTRTQPIRFAIVFSEPVAGFNSSMITRSGTAGGLGGATLVVTNPSSDNRTFEVTVSALTGDGTITLAVPAGVVSDAAGNANAASSFTDSTVTLDTTPPAVSTPDLGPASDSGSSSTDNITNDTTPTFTGTAEAGVSITLLFGSTVLGTATAIGGTWTITPAALADGVYNVFARATDAAGNITESTFVPVTIDTVGPTSAVTRAPGQAASVTATSPALTAQFTVTFSQPIAGLNASDLTIGGTAGAAITNVAGSGASYTVTVGNLTQPGTITLGVNAGVGTDVAGNAGAASPPGEQVSVTFATQTQVQVTPTGIETGGDATVTATVNAPAGTTPGGSVLFAFNGPGGPINRTINLAAGSASTVFTGLAAGAYSVTATYQPATGYVTSSDSENFTVADPFVPGDQNNIGIYAGVAGQTVTVYNAAGTVVRTFAPFTAAEAPGGVRVAVADLDGDGTPDIAAVTGPGSPAALRVFNGATNAEMYRKNLFVDLQGNPFLSGAFVAAGDLTGDGKADLAVTPDQGGGPRVLVLNGPNGTELRSFLAIDDPNFRGGARTTIGDLNGDGVNDIVASAGFGGGPRIAGFDGAELFTTGRRLFNDFFLFEETLRNGAYVTIGDLNGDGFGDLIGGGGPGGGPRVLAIDGKALAQNGDFTPIANFFAGSDALRGGVRVVAKDMDGDGKSEVVTGSGNTGDLFVFFGDELLAGGSAPARSVALAGVLDGVYVG